IFKISALSVSCLMMMSVFTGCGDDKSFSSYSTINSVKKIEESPVKNDADLGKAEIKADLAEAPEDVMAYDDGVYLDAEGEAPEYKLTAGEEVPQGEPEIQPQSGMLTAGEWNDNKNWGFFQNLVQLEKISFPSYGINPINRTEITVKNNSGEAIPNLKAEMLSDDDSVIWSSVTDKDGKAYFFRDNDTMPAKYRISNDGNSQDFNIEYNKTDESSEADDGQQGNSQSVIPESSELIFDSAPEFYHDTEIMFIVDSTGSMSDEMLFLQSEFSAIANEIGTENVKYSVNFYRDKGDDYITKCFDFTNDIQEIQSKLNNERADGGGDMPEAVAEILDETMVNTHWEEKTVKLAFLIFDAPPHNGQEDSLLNSIKTASEKGIRLIPVVSSNSERDTELFGRAISICTNGTYVFLTDDSGIGGSHLDPIIGDYEVEKLYDAIIRIINDYRQ
ncbi:MAG: VWA domain-containing protein, partial [Oscillospiraceae bacterium]|nr:VWA domain-containing protein [Oscillospiraceae bacterium]